MGDHARPPRRILSAVQAVVDAPNEGVVRLLESLLADARAGKVRSIAAAYDGAPGSSGHAAALQEGTALLVYELEALKYLLVGNMAGRESYEELDPA